MAKKLFVGGLSWDTTDATLSQFFSQAGAVISAVVVVDKFSGKSRGFGFVEMSDEDADKAKQTLNGQTLDGRAIAVNEARPLERRDDNRPRGGGFDRGGSGGGGGGGFDRGNSRPRSGGFRRGR